MNENVAALAIDTPVGRLYAIFPSNAEHCELHGWSVEALEYFEDNLGRMSKDHGYLLSLDQLESEEMLKNCNIGALGISVIADFDRNELFYLP